ncbi:transposase [Kosmotoga sp.]|uniref:transposase n=1 Tax=Kosmotoga sp. TaxID=1955248 RepID=UPI003425DFC3
MTVQRHFKIQKGGAGKVEIIYTNEEFQMVYRIVTEFKRILKQKDIESFPGWLRMVKHLDIPGLNHFFRGIRRDLAAVRNAITHKESNGLVEGIINKIKLIKRTMYGRCSFELLRIKVFAS